MPEGQELTPQTVKEQASMWPEKARELVIRDQESYDMAGKLQVGVKALKKKITGVFKPIKQKMDAAKQEVLDQEKAANAPLDETMEILEPKMLEFENKQEEIRKAEEARLQEIARKEAEERQLEEAVQAEKDGNKEEAEAIMEEPPHIPPVVAQPTFQRPKGVSTRKTWKYRIKDETKIPRNYLVPDETAINKVVQAMKDKTSIPGIEVYLHTGMATRTD